MSISACCPSCSSGVMKRCSMQLTCSHVKVSVRVRVRVAVRFKVSVRISQHAVDLVARALDKLQLDAAQRGLGALLVRLRVRVGLGIALGVGLGVGLGFGALLQPQPPPLRAQRRLRLGLLVRRDEPQLADARLAVRLGRLGLGLGLGLEP